MEKNCGNCKYSVTDNGVFAKATFCLGQKEMPIVNLSDTCKDWKSKHKTKADNIREMSDEELAEWLVSHDKKCFLDGPLSKEGYIHWLKQEVESDAKPM